MGNPEKSSSAVTVTKSSGDIIISALRHGKQASYKDTDSELAPDGVQQVIEASNANVVRMQLVEGDRTVAYYSSSRNRAKQSAEHDHAVTHEAVVSGNLDRTTIKEPSVRQMLNPDNILDPFVARYLHLSENEQRVHAFQDWKLTPPEEHEMLGTKSPVQVGEERIAYLKRIHERAGQLSADHTLQARVWMHETDMYAVAKAAIPDFDADGSTLIPHAVAMEIRINAANPEITVQFLGQEGVIYTQNGHSSSVESSAIGA